MRPGGPPARPDEGAAHAETMAGTDEVALGETAAGTAESVRGTADASVDRSADSASDRVTAPPRPEVSGPRPAAPADATDATDALVGRTLGEFVVREKIGEGGFGAVYRADQPLLGREAVIKVLHGRHHADERIIQRFLREAQLASRLDHPFAAHLYAFGAEPDGLLWIAMEYVRGTPLDQVIKVQGPLPLERLVPLLERLCEVLQTAHEQGIVHRDIKPANVMVLSRAGRFLPKLLDLGIAKLVGERADEPVKTSSSSSLDKLLAQNLEATREGAMLGSPPYMAPEQWVSAPTVGPRTDVYALGALAYEALTGRHAFTGKTVMAIARAHATGAVPSLGPKFPPGLDAVLARACAKSADDRFASALEFAQAFRRAAGYETEEDALPRLPEPLRDATEQNAPQPLAEAVGLLDAARTVPQALTALAQTFEVAVRLLGVIALAARSRLGTALGPDAPAVADLLVVLRRRVPTDEEWLELVRGLTRPYLAQPALHPLPELVPLLHGESGAALQPALETLVEVKAALGLRLVDAEARALVGRGVEALATLLGRLAFLEAYPLVVVEQGAAQLWNGLRRRRRPTLALRGPLPEAQPLLATREGAPALLLHPIVQVHEPSPGAARELFFVEGQGRRGARLVALPYGLTRRDPELWDWFKGQLLVDARAGDERVEERAPYRGLAAFRADDAPLFFGREREAEAVANRLRQEPFVVVVGPSGAGKSSFVQAGVAPLLGWRTLVMRPGPSPFLSLASRLGEDGAALVAEALRAEPEVLGQLLREQGPVVLVVDQLEELFTLGTPVEEQEAFAAALLRAAADPDGPVRVVATLRDDFLLRAEQLAALRPRLSSSLQLLGTPDPAALVRVLTEPLRVVGYEFEDKEQPERMAAEVASLPGALPLLSFTASRLWELRDRHFKQLPRAAYESLGGVGGALAKHAEETLQALRPDEQRLVREAFRHLVTAEGTRAILARADLVHLVGGAAGRGAEAEAVLERLVGARLLVSADAPEGGQRIEIIHEALLGAWPRLVEWRREDAEGARLRDQLRAAARQWDERGRPRGLLWRGDALLELRVWRGRHGQTLTPVDAAFADASVADEARGRRRRLALLTGAIAVLAIGLFTVTQLYRRSVRAERESRERLAASYEDQGRRELLGHHPEQALPAFKQALELGRDTPALRVMLHRAFAELSLRERSFEDTADVNVAAAGGGRVFLGGDARRLLSFDAATGQRRWEGPLLDTPIVDVAVSPDGALVAVASVTSEVVILDATTGAPRARLPGGERIISRARRLLWPSPGRVVLRTAAGIVALDAATGQVAWRHPYPARPRRVALDGTTIWAAFDDGQLRALDATTGQERTAWPSAWKRLQTLEVGAPGKLLVADETGHAALVDATTGRPLITHEAPPFDGVHPMRLSPSGARLFRGSERLAVVLDTQSGRLLSQHHHPSPVIAALFLDDDHVVTSTIDGTLWLWRVGHEYPLASLGGHVGLTVVERFDATRVLAWGGRRVSLWRLRPPGFVGELLPRGPGIKSLRASGDQLVVARESGVERVALASRSVTRLWTAPAPLEDAALADDVAAVLIPTLRLVSLGATRRDVVPGVEATKLDTVALSASGRTLAVADLSDRVTLLDAATGALAPPWAGLSGAMAVDDRQVATALPDAQLELRDRVGRLRCTLPGHPGAIALRLALSPSGDRLASLGSDQTIAVWDTGSCRLVARVGEHTSIPFAVAVASTGLIASVDDLGTLRLSDPSTAHVVWEAQHGSILSSGASRAITFSPDGASVFVGSGDGRVTAWEVSPEPGSAADLQARIAAQLAGAP